MARKPRARPAVPAGRPDPAAVVAVSPLPLRLARGVLLAALAAAGLAVDPYAAAAFDAPHRLALLLGAGLGLLCLLWLPERAPLNIPFGRARWMLGGVAFALLWSLLSTAVNGWVAGSDSLRVLLLAALLLPLAASPRLAEVARTPLAWTAATAIALNGLLSLWQLAGLPGPWTVAALGGRLPSAALLGNEGYVALACALAVGPAAVVWRHAGATRGARAAAAALLLLAVLVIVANRQLTAALAAMAGGVLVWAARPRLLPALRALVLLGLLALAGLATPPLREATWVRALPLDTPQLLQLSTYRWSAWAAAEQMWVSAPWFGHGPGSFSRHSQTFRLQAELSLRERLPPPPTASGFTEAHNEYLQVAAEAGLPALGALLLACLLLLDGLARRAASCPESRALLGLLGAAAVAALAWFPLQIPLTAMLVLLAAGRGWRLLARGGDPA